MLLYCGILYLAFLGWVTAEDRNNTMDGRLFFFYLFISGIGGLGVWQALINLVFVLSTYFF